MAVTRVVVLHSLDSEAVGRPVLLGDQPIVLGRAGHASGPLALDDPELSREHAVLEPYPDGWRLRDLGSLNGCAVNGDPAREAPLRDGDVIRAGSTVLQLQEVRLRTGEPLAPEAPPLLGPSIAMQRLRADIARVAPRTVPVLVLGESGVGKELAAHALHAQSGRRGAFVPVNCGAIPESLVEGELFGHVAGAFTGAARARAGLFAAAAGGTLFLDEIGEMPIGVQPRLLRALATGEVRPVGSTTAVHVDVRVVAATNREDLEGAVVAGTFRGDLYARLAGWTLRIAPLRDRREDVLPLARHLLAAASGPTDLTADAAEALVLHEWPYNVRELAQAMGAAAVRAEGAGALDLPHLDPEVAARVERRTERTDETSVAPPLELLVRRDGVPNRDDLVLVLTRFGGNMAQVADYFGKDRRQVYRWAERLGVDPAEFRSEA